MHGQGKDEILILRDGRRLGYAAYGDPGGWPLLFFHGTPGSRVMARFAAPKAQELGVRLIAPERPGFGLSDRQPRRQLLDWVEDVRELADALGLERFAVAGVSGGGPYVAACAKQIPTRLIAVGIISGLAPLDRVSQDLNRLRWLSAMLMLRAPGLITQMLRLMARCTRTGKQQIMRSMCWLADPGSRKILSRAEVQRTLMDSLGEAFRQGHGGAADEAVLLSRPWGFAVEEIEVAVHLWHGLADTIVPVVMGRYLAEHLPHCQARFIPGAGHLWIFEGYEEVFRALR